MCAHASHTCPALSPLSPLVSLNTPEKNPNKHTKPKPKKGWWYKPDFVIHELNINSAVATPAHDETLALGDNAPYAMTGYAYSGARGCGE